MMLPLLVAQASAPAPAPKTHTVEVDLHFGLSYDVGEQAIQELALSDHRFGETFSVAAVYKTRYFLSPFVDVGYSAVSSGGTLVPFYQYGGPAIADQRLSLWNVSSGFAFDTWRLRFQAGLGLGVVVLRARVGADESHSARLAPLALFATSLDLVRAPRFALALKLQALLSSQHLDVQVFSAGLEIRGDLVRF